jgi:RNA polymerase sigma-70 factor (ECF subfamily)
MNKPSRVASAVPLDLADDELVRRILGGEAALFAVLMRRNNQRLYRVARGIVGEGAEAEDVVQETWIKAFAALGGFEGRARLSTWLTRIAAHEALARRRRKSGGPPREPPGDEEDDGRLRPRLRRGPEESANDGELRLVLEEAVDALPAMYRSVFVLREVEELSTREAADVLGVSEDALKVRLHRAKLALRVAVEARLGAAVRTMYGFDGARCDRMVAAVMGRIGQGT